ncbi:MAG TPA: RNA pseudouridine synthase [Bacteroidales bacterium]|nr:RNA pseudouridine synthase [Bacteroidales bacterium]HRR92827.1 RNA pseudouridine synthase [Bacteroidales bacterium]HRT89837.1 RNA pseudouridine synthase [Bacteroidales bacterium]
MNLDTSLQILYEDNHLIAVNKKASDLSQGDSSGDEPLDARIKRYLAVKYNKPGEVFLGVVHRLDRPVSGVVLYARTSKALARMNEIFRTREVRKIYWAVVSEKPPQAEGRLENYLRKNEKQNKSFVYNEPSEGTRRAELTYKLAGVSERYYLLEIELHTGRHHQIRAQLAAAGMPVKGDLKYGAKRSNPDGSISLHARSLQFIHPVKKEEILIIAPLPQTGIWKLFEGK